LQDAIRLLKNIIQYRNGALWNRPVEILLLITGKSENYDGEGNEK